MRRIQSQAIDQLLLCRPIKKLELRQHRQISISVDCAILRWILSRFPFDGAQAPLCGFYDLMSRETISRRYFYLRLRLHFAQHIKLIFEKSQNVKRKGKQRANCNLKYSPMNNLSPFPPYHCQISLLRDVLHRVGFAVLWLEGGGIIYRAAGCASPT